MSSVPKAVLYYSPQSVWSAAALLTVEEKGYGSDEIDLKVVDLGKGENYDPSFLRINPNATVPTLVVPLQKTLSEDVESRYKAITSTQTIVEFLDKSRSAMSRTHTTSSLPAPSLTPATIAFTTTCSTIVKDILHSEAADPNRLARCNARDETSLRSLSAAFLPGVQGRERALGRFLADAEAQKFYVTEKVRNFWQEKKTAANTFAGILGEADKPNTELNLESQQKRDGFFQTGKKVWEVDLKEVISKLEKEIVGPYALGEQISIADMHLAAWLARVFALAGVNLEDDGKAALSKLEKHIGTDLTEKKLGAFWDVVRGRASFKKVYGGGLY